MVQADTRLARWQAPHGGERLRLWLYRVAYHFEKCLAGGG
jgi:hypothetical protein